MKAGNAGLAVIKKGILGMLNNQIFAVKRV